MREREREREKRRVLSEKEGGEKKKKREGSERFLLWRDVASPDFGSFWPPHWASEMERRVVLNRLCEASEHGTRRGSSSRARV